MKFCPTCKNTFEDTLTECPNDGTPLQDSSAPQDAADKELSEALDDATEQTEDPSLSEEEAVEPPLSDDLENDAPSEAPKDEDTTELDLDALGKALNNPTSEENAAHADDTEDTVTSIPPTDTKSENNLFEPMPQTEQEPIEEDSIVEDPKETKPHSKKPLLALLLLILLGIIGLIVGLLVSPSSASALPSVQFNSTPQGATVLIDSKEVGNTPITVKVKPGKHKVLFQHNGFSPIDELITVDKDGTVFSRELKPANGSQ